MKFTDLTALQTYQEQQNRIYQLGLWAGRVMGMSDEEAELYAIAVIKSDFQVPGVDDVVEKIVTDLRKENINLSEQSIRDKFTEADFQTYS